MEVNFPSENVREEHLIKIKNKKNKFRKRNTIKSKHVGSPKLNKITISLHTNRKRNSQ